MRTQLKRLDKGIISLGEILRAGLILKLPHSSSEGLFTNEIAPGSGSCCSQGRIFEMGGYMEISSARE
jgi:hypothetical protein